MTKGDRRSVRLINAGNIAVPGSGLTSAVRPGAIGA
jgi:hypothetical protein